MSGNISRLGERGSGGKWKGAAAAAGGRRGSTAENTGPQQAGNSPRLLLKESRLLAFVSALTSTAALPLPPFFFTSSHSPPLPFFPPSAPSPFWVGGARARRVRWGWKFDRAPRRSPHPWRTVVRESPGGGGSAETEQPEEGGAEKGRRKRGSFLGTKLHNRHGARERRARVGASVPKAGLLGPAPALSPGTGVVRPLKGERPAKVLFAQPPDRQPLTARLFRLGMKGGGRLQPLF